MTIVDGQQLHLSVRFFLRFAPHFGRFMATAFNQRPMAERHDDGVRGQTFGFVDGHHADTATLLFGWQRGLRECFVPILQKITQIRMAFVEIIVQVIHEGEEIFAFVAEILSGIVGIKGQVSVNGVHHFGERQLREAFAFGFEGFE